MKVGTDAVLLGAWASAADATKILDIGCGCGIIALMLAQRSEKAFVYAIDIDKPSVCQAAENIRNSPWPDRLKAEAASLQDFTVNTALRFDLIVSNPPFFNRSLPAPDCRRNQARHTGSLTHDELIRSASSLLLNSGRIALVLPLSEAEYCIKTAQDHDLHLHRKTLVFPKPHSAAKRVLLEFTRQKPLNLYCSELTIETELRHDYSPDFIDLLKDFYLKF